jgi:hypothetical protein
MKPVAPVTRTRLCCQSTDLVTATSLRQPTIRDLRRMVCSLSAQAYRRYPRKARYQATVSRNPSRSECSGHHPSKRLALVLSRYWS